MMPPKRRPPTERSRESTREEALQGRQASGHLEAVQLGDHRSDTKAARPGSCVAGRWQAARRSVPVEHGAQAGQRELQVQHDAEEGCGSGGGRGEGGRAA